MRVLDIRNIGRKVGNMLWMRLRYGRWWPGIVVGVPLMVDTFGWFVVIVSSDLSRPVQRSTASVVRALTAAVAMVGNSRMFTGGRSFGALCMLKMLVKRVLSILSEKVGQQTTRMPRTSMAVVEVGLKPAIPVVRVFWCAHVFFECIPLLEPMNLFILAFWLLAFTRLPMLEY